MLACRCTNPPAAPARAPRRPGRESARECATVSESSPGRNRRRSTHSSGGDPAAPARRGSSSPDLSPAPRPESALLADWSPWAFPRAAGLLRVGERLAVGADLNLRAVGAGAHLGLVRDQPPLLGER